MTSSDALLRQARAIAAAAFLDDDRLDGEWQAMCAGSRDALLARLGTIKSVTMTDLPVIAPVKPMEGSPEVRSNRTNDTDADDLRQLLRDEVETSRHLYFEHRKR